MDFKQNEAKTFTIYVPPNSVQDKNNRINGLTITAAPLVPGLREVSLGATSKKGKSASLNYQQGQSAWENGKALKISEDEYFEWEWCTDCTFKILVDVNDAGRYKIMAKTNVGQPTIYENQQIQDIAMLGETNCYKYTIQDPTSDLSIKTRQFNGLINLYVNPRYELEEGDEPLYYQYSFESSNLLLSERTRKKNNDQGGLHYICVQAIMTSSYYLTVTEIDSNAPYIELQDGFQEEAQVFGDFDYKVFIYKVPVLDYAGEDISLDFRLYQFSGLIIPIFGVQQCYSSDPLDCAQDVRISDITQFKSNWHFGQYVVNEQVVNINHDESICKRREDQCYYTVVVVGEDLIVEDFGQEIEQEEEHVDDDPAAQFLLSVHHTQNNYRTMVEGQQISDEVNVNTYKYYKFQLFDNNIEKVQFFLSSFHGDADLVVSRDDPFPTMEANEYGSMKSSSFVDTISYSNDTTPHTNSKSTYFVGVFGWEYSQFSLYVQVQRSGDGVQMTQKATSLLLSQGYSVKGQMSSLEERMYYRFDVNMQPGVEKDIFIKLDNLDSKCDVYVGYEYVPDPDNFDQVSDELDKIQIKQHYNDYHATGTYYLTVIPHNDYFYAFFYTNWEYKLTYYLDGGLQFLGSGVSQTFTNEGKGRLDYQYTINNFDNDLTLTMTVLQGQPKLNYNTQQSNLEKIHDNYAVDFSQTSFNGYTKTISADQLRYNCSRQDSCNLYIATYCTVDCQYYFSIQNSEDQIRQVVLGQTLSDTVDEGKWKYYHLSVNERQVNESSLFAILDSVTNNADIYVQTTPNAQSKPMDQWKKPTTLDYKSKSTAAGRQDVVRLDSETINTCFGFSNGAKDTNDRNTIEMEDRIQNYEDPDYVEKECGIVIGINGAQTYNYYETELLSSYYELIVYMDIIELRSDQAVSMIVDQGEYQYFTYDVSCDDCYLILTVNTISEGDPDIFVAYGTEYLPTREKNDFHSNTFLSETLEISLKDKYFQNLNKKSMKGTYIIGIYGSQYSDLTRYMLVASQQTHPISFLVDGISTRGSLESYDKYFYKWYNYQEGDIEFILNVQSGKADLFVSTVEELQDENLANKLPISKSKSYFWLDDVSPISSGTQKTLKILSEQRNYCTQCTFLAGVVTHSENAEYSLTVTPYQHNFYSDMILSLGEEYSLAILKDETRTYQFISEVAGKVTLTTQVSKGKINTVLKVADGQNSQDLKQVGNVKNTGSIEIEADDLQIGQFYTIEVTCSKDAEYSISVVNAEQLTMALDGIPYLLTFEDKNDIQKNLIFPLQEGEVTIKLQMSKVYPMDFKPVIYYKFINDLSTLSNFMTFDARSQNGYKSIAWSNKDTVQKYTVKYNSVQENGGLAIVIKETNKHRADNGSAQIYFTASQSKEIQLQEDVPYIGTLYTDDSFNLYKIDQSMINPGNKLVLEFEQCIGKTNYKFISNPEDFSSTVQVNNRLYKWGKDTVAININDFHLNNELYVLVEEQELVYNEKRIDNGGEKAEFYIRAYQSTNEQLIAKNLDFQLNRDIDWSMNQKKLTLSWEPILNSNYMDQVYGASKERAGEVVYQVIYTANMDADLDSICAMNYDAMKYLELTRKEFTDVNGTIYLKKSNRDYYVNVFAHFQDGPYAGEVIPYIPILVHTNPYGFISFMIDLVKFIIASIIILACCQHCFGQQGGWSHPRNRGSIVDTGRKFIVNILERIQDLRNGNSYLPTSNTNYELQNVSSDTSTSQSSYQGITL